MKELNSLTSSVLFPSPSRLTSCASKDRLMHEVQHIRENFLSRYQLQLTVFLLSTNGLHPVHDGLATFVDSRHQRLAEDTLSMEAQVVVLDGKVHLPCHVVREVELVGGAARRNLVEPVRVSWCCGAQVQTTGLGGCVKVCRSYIIHGSGGSE